MQPSLVQYWTNLLAEAKTKKGELEIKLDFVKAEANLEYRRSPPEGVKITEDVIKNLVMVDVAVVQAETELMEAISEVNTLQSACESIHAKGEAIKIEQNLFTSGYWAMPSGSANRDKRKDLIAE
jgi:hypothetical protein